MHPSKEIIKEKARNYYSKVLDIRRHIHQNPELSKEEYQTAKYVESYLDKLGISHERMAETGVIGLIKGNPKGETIALRADMDALPITEKNDTHYSSQHKNVMHACGHDAHTAMLLGTAYILQEMQSELNGNIVLIFQPSEERFPGGAKKLLEEGLFEKYHPSVIFGQHVDPDIQCGHVGMKSEEYMASTDEIYLHVKGKGGHAATPDKNTDTVLLASQILNNLQQISARNAPPEIPTVLSFGRFITEGQTNIIPDEAKLAGTFRTFNETWRKKAHQRIRDICRHTASLAEGSCEVVIEKGYPSLINDKPLTENTFSLATGFLGEKNVYSLPVRMTAEDFSYYSQQIPSCFYRLGIRNENQGITSNLHTSTFNIDESSLETGMGFMSWLAINYLQRGSFS